MKKTYYIKIEGDDGKAIVDSFATAVDAIAVLQDVISTLRRPELPQFDASFGEAPLPITGPSREELSRFLNQAQRA